MSLPSESPLSASPVSPSQLPTKAVASASRTCYLSGLPGICVFRESGRLRRAMKDDIHPKYHDVVFVDSSTGTKFLMRSTINTPKTTEYEGKTYPMVTVDISSASHPFYTGQQKFVDTAGRVEKFQRKYKWDQRNQKTEG